MSRLNFRAISLIIQYCIVVMVLLSPLGALPKYMLKEIPYFSISKILFLLVILLHSLFVLSKRMKIDVGKLDLAILFFGLSLVVSIIRFPDVDLAYIVVASVFGYLCLNMVIQSHMKEMYISKALDYIVYSALISSLIAFVQFLTGVRLLDVFDTSKLYYIGDSFIVLGTEENANAFSAVFIMPFVVSSARYFFEHRKTVKLFYLCSNIIFFLSLMLTICRATVMSVFIAELVVLACLYFIVKIKLSKIFIYGLIYILVIISWSIFMPTHSVEILFGKDPLITKFESLNHRILLKKYNFLESTRLYGPGEEKIRLLNYYHKKKLSLIAEGQKPPEVMREQRYFLKEKSMSKDIRKNLTILNLKVFAENPLLGIGFNRFRINSGKQLGFTNGDTLTPHSNILGIASELGLSGLLPYLFILLYTVYVGFKAVLKKGSENKSELISLLAAYIGFIIFGLFHTSFVTVLSWIVMSFIVVFSKNILSEKKYEDRFSP